MSNSIGTMLTGSVGREGNNRKEDVETVQSLLNSLMPINRLKLAIDGRNGPKTMGAISDFQTKVCKFRKADSRVDPGGRTWMALNNDASAALWAQASSMAPDMPSRPVQDSVPVDVPRSTGLDLINDGPAMAVFFPHLKQREGIITHFYCDNKDLVTIGIGSLVDMDGTLSQRDAFGRSQCRELLNTWRVQFLESDGSIASEESVFSDWKRVRDGKVGARASANIARLRISKSSAEALARKQIAYFANGMCRKYPYARQLHTWIQMALIDTRWNPAKRNPWGTTSLVNKMWKLLDPDKPTFDPIGAHALFVEGWKGRGTPAYQVRVAWRNERFLEGAMRMIA